MFDAARTPPFGIAVALALLAGVSLCLALPFLPPWPLLGVMLAAGAGYWWRGRVMRWAGPLLLAFALAGLHASHALALQLPGEWEQREVVVSGRLVDLPEHEARRTRFLFRVDSDDAQPAPLRGRLLRLAWYDHFDGSSSGRERLLAGQGWKLTVRVRAPRGLRNPGTLDNEKHAMARRLAATGYVRDPQSAMLASPPRGLHAWRESMSARIADAVPASSSRFVRALALGDTRALDDDDWMKLRANGLTHLIAISGFHVGLVAGFFALAIAGIWWLFPSLSNRLPRPIAAAVAGLAGAAMYAAVAGFALPTVRTVLMIAAVAAVRILRRRSSAFETLALAGIAVLLIDPLASISAGFWLSFFGVAWLLWCLPDAGKRPLHDFLSAQGVASLGLLPLSVVLFGQASLAGPFANLLAVPWWSLVVVPLALIGTGLEFIHDGWGGLPWRAAAWCFDLAWPVFERLAATELALWWLPEPRWFALPLACLAAFWMLLPRGVPGKTLALLLWLPLLLPARNLPAQGEAEMVVLDVGQGLSVLVRTRHHALLYDMGPAVRDGFDAGERAVLPALQALGAMRLDRAVVSHGDSDHAGGFPAVRKAIPLARAYAPEGSPIEQAETCRAGDEWIWDGVRFRFLHPPPHFPYMGNEASCVLRVETRHGAMLLTGDIGEVIERTLVWRDLESVRAEVVMIAHHGSGHSSDPEFISATGARFALVSTGHGNRFGHPRADVLQRWRLAGAQTHDTAEGGALQVRVGASGIHVETRRRAHPRLWDAVARSEQARAGLSYRPD
ncbi:MAG: DNA internalization-related competence protein ComEC/Rec2 [Pseudomonadota bacterium]|nr:DNA internalization-related competence protein ComEC/Rec2 [Pseudomonadota bacterium]